jgi:PAS domain-containing protein
MPQREIEVILTRQLASYLSLPIFIVDPEGTLIFYNEPAEAILGHRFEETGEMPADEWATIYTAPNGSNDPVAPEQLPLMIALRERQPAHGQLAIHGLDNVRRLIEVTAFPLVGQAGRHLGAVALFWEVKP